MTRVFGRLQILKPQCNSLLASSRLCRATVGGRTAHAALAVTMPAEAANPATSAVLVSGRTRITESEPPHEWRVRPMARHLLCHG